MKLIAPVFLQCIGKVCFHTPCRRKEQTVNSEQNQHMPQQKESAPRNTHEVVYRELAKRLSQGLVLDLPAGSGAFTQRLVDNAYEVTAGDLVQHPALPDVEFHFADMNGTLPFRNHTFDAIVSIEGIEHIQRPFDFAKECRRILKPGGWLFITTPNISSLRSRWRYFLTGFHNKGKYPLDEQNPQPRHHINLLSFPELRYLLHTNKLTIEAIHTNRIKTAAWLYLPCWPLAHAVSALVFRAGVENAAHHRQVKAILRQMMSPPVFLGESMIIIARAEE